MFDATKMVRGIYGKIKCALRQRLIIIKTRSGILADGGRIAASGPSEFVRVLREGSWFDSGCTDKEYMMNFSGRYRELHGVTVRTDTPEHFMDDLKKYGYIKG